MSNRMPPNFKVHKLNETRSPSQNEREPPFPNRLDNVGVSPSPSAPPSFLTSSPGSQQITSGAHVYEQLKKNSPSLENGLDRHSVVLNLNAGLSLSGYNEEKEGVFLGEPEERKMISLNVGNNDKSSQQDGDVDHANHVKYKIAPKNYKKGKEQPSSTHFFGVWFEKYKMCTALFILAFIGMILLGQVLSYVYSHNYEIKKVTKRENNFDNYNDLAKKTASLARLLNAIVLQIGIYSGNASIMPLFKDALKVNNLSSFSLINQTNLFYIVHSMKQIDVLSENALKLTNKRTSNFHKLEVENEFYFKTLACDTLIFLNSSKLDLGEIPSMVFSAASDLRSILKKMKSKTTNGTFDFSVLNNFDDVFLQLSEESSVSLLYNNTKAYIDCLENISPYIDVINHYQELIDRSYLKNVKASMKILQLSSQIMESLINARPKEIIEQLTFLYELITPTVSVIDKQAHVDFPQGSEDLKLILKDLDSEWFKQIFNRGDSLDELKSLLGPVSKLSTSLAAAEKTWNERTRNIYSNMLLHYLNFVKKIQETNRILISSSLSNVSAMLEELTTMGPANNSLLEEVKNAVNPSKFFKSISSELKAVSILSNTTRSFMNDIKAIKKQKKDNAKLNRSQTVNFTEEVFSLVEKIVCKVDLLENQTKIVMKFLSQIYVSSEVNTSSLFANIRNVVKLSQSNKSHLKKTVDFVEFVSSLPKLKKQETIKMGNLPSFLYLAKNQSENLSKTEESLLKQIKEIANYRRLMYFPFPHELAIELSTIQRTLVLYQKPNLGQLFEKHVRNGMALKTRIQDFPELEEHLFDWGTSNGFIKNVSQLLLEVEALPTQFATKANRFKDIGEEFTKLEKVPTIPLDFLVLTSIIESLKRSSIGMFDELNNVEESLEGLSLLQYSSQPPDEHLTEKLVKAEKALRNLFGKAVTLSPSWVDILWFVLSAVFWLILCVVAIVASTILGIVISWIKEGWEKYEEQNRIGT